MGVEYSAVIVVGLPRKELRNLDNLADMLYKDESLQVIPPYYDGDNSGYAIIGIPIYSSPDYAPSELKMDCDVIQEAFTRFKELTNLDAKIYLSPRGY